MFTIISNEKKFLITIFLLSLIIRFFAFNSYFGKEKNYWNLDTIAYNEAAISLYEGKGFTNQDGSYHFYRLPLYSFFLACCYKIFGLDIKKALVVQVIIASFIPILIFILSLTLLPTKIFLAKLLTLICCLHLGFILYSCIAMTETIFLIFFFIFCILLFQNFEPFFSKKIILVNTKNLLLSGIFLGIASLIRPVGHYVIITSILMLLLSNERFSTSLKNSAFLFVGWSLIIGPWLLRNFLLTGHIFFHTLPGIHFLRYSAIPIKMKTENISYNDAWGKLLDEWKDKNLKQEMILNRPLLEIEKCKNAEKISFSYLKAFPLLALRYAIFNIFKTCIALYSSELLYIDSGLPPIYFEKGKSWWNLFERFIFPKASHHVFRFIIYFEILFLFLMLLGFSFQSFYTIIYQENIQEYLKVIPFIFLFILITLASGFARVRLPIEPFIMLLSLNWWLDRISLLNSFSKSKQKIVVVR